MKDILIVLAILLILVAVFSHTPTEDTAPDTDGTQKQGESDTVQSEGDHLLQDIPEESPQTGDRFYWLWQSNGVTALKVRASKRRNVG